MESAVLGLVLDSGILIAAERRKRPPAEVIENVIAAVRTVPIILSALTVAEIGHGIYRHGRCLCLYLFCHFCYDT